METELTITAALQLQTVDWAATFGPSAEPACAASLRSQLARRPAASNTRFTRVFRALDPHFGPFLWGFLKQGCTRRKRPDGQRARFGSGGQAEAGRQAGVSVSAVGRGVLCLELAREVEAAAADEGEGVPCDVTALAARSKAEEEGGFPTNTSFPSFSLSAAAADRADLGVVSSVIHLGRVARGASVARPADRPTATGIFCSGEYF